ncbi:MAG TPA: multicopper oxidase domain-containing protein, partial [Longimicrobium sp.]|nr:multicopper oxidase domain-containing protein [Longimicrobium sp.]
MSAPHDTQTDNVQPTRRDFLRFSALGLAVPLAGAAVAACSPGGAESGAAAAAPAAGAAPHADSNHSGGTTAAHPRTPAEIRAAADAMDAHHEAGIKAFPAKTQGQGNQLLQPRMENGVKVYELTVASMKWETEPGKQVDAFAYNGQVPGPQIRVTEGDRVRVVVRNQLDQSTAVH